MEGNAAASVIASEDLQVAAALQRTLQRGLLRLYTNHDVIGCELGGALKNVIAIASGIAEGLEVGDNTRAAVMTRGLAEFTRLGVAMGGEQSTLAGLAGMGDLIVTCISPHSRNRSVGEQLGRGRSLDEVLGGMTMVAEGVKAAVAVHDLAARLDLELPVCDTIYDVVTGEIAAADAYRGSPSSGRPRVRSRLSGCRAERAQSLAGSGLASFNTSGVPSSAGMPSPGLVHSNSIVSSAST